MIWLKRLSPFILILVAWYSFTTIQSHLEETQKAEEEELAQIASRIWISSARLRNDPEQYLKHRDSLLEAEGVDRDRFFDFVERFENKGEELLPFSIRLRELVDSLHLVELNKIDSTQRVQDSLSELEKNDSLTQ